MSHEIPYFPVYPGDYLKSPVASCSEGAQMLYFRLKMIAHSSECYGYIWENGKQITDIRAAARSGLLIDRYLVLFAELRSVGLPTASDNGYYFPDMVELEQERRASKERQKRFRRRKTVTVLSRNSNGEVTANEDEDVISSSDIVVGDVVRRGWFDDLWKQYPRPLGRKAALRSFMGSVKTARGLDRIKVALVNYRAKLVEEKTDPAYIQHGSTWFNNWDDWIEIKTYDPIENEVKKKQEKSERWKSQGLSVCHGSAVEVLDDELRHCVSCLEVQP